MWLSHRNVLQEALCICSEGICLENASIKAHFFNLSNRPRTTAIPITTISPLISPLKSIGFIASPIGLKFLKNRYEPCDILPKLHDTKIKWGTRGGQHMLNQCSWFQFSSSNVASKRLIDLHFAFISRVWIFTSRHQVSQPFYVQAFLIHANKTI